MDKYKSDDIVAHWSLKKKKRYFFPAKWHVNYGSQEPVKEAVRKNEASLAIISGGLTNTFINLSLKHSFKIHMWQQWEACLVVCGLNTYTKNGNLKKAS